MFDPAQAFAAERIVLPVLAVLYFAAAVLYCPPELKNPARRKTIKSIGFVVHTTAVIVHAFTLFLRIQSTHHAPFAGLYETLLSLSWCMGFVFLALWWKRQTRGYGAAAAGAAWTLVVLMIFIQLLAPALTVPRYLVAVVGTSPFFEAHVAPALPAYACFTLAFFAAFASLGADKQTRRKRRSAAELYLWAGMILFTLSLGLGAAGTWLAWGRWWVWEPKSAFALATWGLFFLALVERGRASRRAFPWLVIAGFAAMLLTYILDVFTRQGLHDFL